ncbi:glycosyltransferase family 9 protein [Nibricoccus sp. IMCC34717]|uniref:glycosyltransferase family 9 protein n=1 Tax=Nibricoccus sp. IMCC34717 TaxID=3034021 RepID=UPI00384C7256
MDHQPKSLVYLRPDTIGDLVLFSAALAELKERWPTARHTVVVRPGYEALAELLPAGIEWLTTSVNPFRDGPRDAAAALAQTLADLAERSPDVIVAATLTRTWFEAAVAAHFPAARRVSLGRAAVDPLFATALRLERGVAVQAAFAEWVEVDPLDRDWANTSRLVTALTGKPSDGRLPSLRLSPAVGETAAGTVRGWGLEGRRWVALFPGGLANVPIKAWPACNFAEAAVQLVRSQGVAVVLFGHHSDVPVMDEVERHLVAAGLPKPPRWVGQEGQLPLLAALLGRTALYLGNDTGAMHIAAAVGAPTFGIFGGGHWPRFRPVGRQVGAAVQPLACFNCGWDCHFNEALCVKTLGVATVVAGATRVLQAGDATLDFVAESQDLAPDVRGLIAAAAPRFRRLQADRLERQARIEELKQETDGKDVEIEALKRSAEERKAEMESIKAELEAECAEKTAEIEDKDVEIAALKKSAEERKTEMEAIKAELEAECDDKDAEIAQLKKESDGKDSEISQLKDVCNEREALIITQDQHIKRFQKLIADHEEAFAARDKRLETLENQLNALPPDAALWGQAMHDKDVHIRNLGAIIYERDAALRELSGRISNFEAGLHGLEAAKYFGKLLAEKEAVLQSLHEACVAREKVIQELALTNAGLGRLHKVWVSAREHARLRWWLPLKQWAFRKVVEEYWMQIGVLRHHDPKPIVWDRMPAPKVPDDQLPAIGLVTPSYGQATYLESTMLSVLNQQYPKIKYVVQDGGSRDASPEIIARYADRLHHWESVRDNGQADAIRRGFLHLDRDLGPDDLMAWLNSDDFIAPRTLRYVASYFATHPDVDVVYGHRIIINEHDQEVGRWIMPRHDNATLEWIDYVPQETLFWRKRLWDRVGGIDPTFQFALDWDLLARFQLAGAKIVRLPYALGCFRVHAEQKTSQHIHTIGNEEMIRVRRRFHGDRHSDGEKIQHYARKARFSGAITARLAALGIRY